MASIDDFLKNHTKRIPRRRLTKKKRKCGGKQTSTGLKLSQSLMDWLEKYCIQNKKWLIGVDVVRPGRAKKEGQVSFQGAISAILEMFLDGKLEKFPMLNIDPEYPDKEVKWVNIQIDTYKRFREYCKLNNFHIRRTIENVINDFMLAYLKEMTNTRPF